MKKLSFFFIGSLLIFGAAACNNPYKTSEIAPDTAYVIPTETPDAQAIQAAQEDAQSLLRRRQLNANIRARERRNDWGGDDAIRDPADLASEVGSKLEANIPRGILTIEASKDGTVIVGGFVTNERELAKIEPLAKEIKGVNNVIVNAKVITPNSSSG